MTYGTRMCSCRGEGGSYRVGAREREHVATGNLSTPCKSSQVHNVGSYCIISERLSCKRVNWVTLATCTCALHLATKSC